MSPQESPRRREEPVVPALAAVALATVALAALVLAAAAALAPLRGAAAAAPPVRASPVWGWPVPAPPAPEVLRGFSPPAHRWDPGDRGVDLSAVPGSPVLAPSGGVVVFAGRVAGRGVVVVRAASGLRSSLLPVDPAVARGARVRRGQPVGALAGGAPWCPGAPCLHWGVLTGGGHQVRYRDPLALLRARAPVLLPLVGAQRGASGRP